MKATTAAKKQRPSVPAIVLKYVRRKMQKKFKVRELTLITFATVGSVLCLYTSIQHHQLAKYEKQINKLTSQNKDLSSTIDERDNRINALIQASNMQVASLESNINELHSMAEEASNSYGDLQVNYSELQSQYESLQTEYNEAVARLQTYSDYSYMFYDTEGQRNDITVEQVNYAVDLMTKKGYDPDLLLGTIMVESEGHADDVNSYSGATGYGQFMAGTGKFVYEQMLGLGEYDHSTTPKDGTTNILLMATYYEYLYKLYHGDTFKVVKQYCGGSDSFTARYLAKVEKVVGHKIY